MGGAILLLAEGGVAGVKCPLFSCVVPVKGGRPYLAEALASLRAQGMGNDLEVIIQDGDIEPDGGQSDAFNKGFAKAHGAWFFWLNADDILLPGALAKVKGCIDRLRSERPGNPPVWIAGNEWFIDANGKTVGCSIGTDWHDGLYRHAVPHVNGPSSFFRRELFAQVGGFDTTLRFCMDWDLWIRFMHQGARFERISDFLWAQRRWMGSKTQKRLSACDAQIQGEEIRAMLAKNRFSVTKGGVLKLRLWKLFRGYYLKEMLCGRSRA